MNERTSVQRPRAAVAGHGPADHGAAGRSTEPHVASVVSAGTRGSGRPLDAQSRGLMEGRFGHDFSQVRVYTDAQAEVSAEALGARAYTLGTDVVFGAGQYD